MANSMVRGVLVGVVDGPKMIIEINGQEHTYPLGTDLTADWVMGHMDQQVIARVSDGRIVEVG